MFFEPLNSNFEIGGASCVPGLKKVGVNRDPHFAGAIQLECATGANDSLQVRVKWLHYGCYRYEYEYEYEVVIG